MSQTLLAGATALAGALLWLARDERACLPAAIAIGAILYPATDAILDFVHVAELVGQPTTLEALTPRQLARMPWTIVESNLLVPLTGLALAAALGAQETAWRFLAPFRRRASAWSMDLTLGWAAVPLIVAAEGLALAALQGPASFLQTADESALFANATLVHVVLLSVTPAVAEELYYRNLLQGGLETLWPGARGAWVALVAQAVIFALAHASYTSLAHLLGPLVFGLGMGALRSIGGLGACMVGHAGVNLFYFSVDPGAGSAALLVAVGVISVLGLVVLALTWETIRGRIVAGVRPVMPD